VRNIIVYDDFYQDPDAVRKAVLDRGFPIPRGGTYPGRMSDAFIPTGLLNLFSSIAGTEVFRPLDDRSWFGQFRISLEGDPFEQWIHMDPSDWSAILYLNPPGTTPDGYGTSFWTHKETGWSGYPGKTDTQIVTQEMKDKGYNSYQEIRERIIYKDGLDETKWIHDIFIPGKYNRLVMFRPWLWHSHMPKNNFGNTDETGRLVQLFFMREVR